MTNKRRALIVAYNFPPANTIGSLRMLRLVKQLDQLGWSAHVLTVQESLTSFPNPALVSEIPKEIEITRTWMINPTIIGRRLINQAGSLFRKIGPAEAPPRSRAELKNRISVLMRRYFMIPDDMIGWLPFGLKAGLEIIQKQNIDAIYASAPPFSDFLIGAGLKARTGLPLIFEYRDTWSDFSLYPEEFSSIKKRAIVSLENEATRFADYIITLTDVMNQDIEAKFPDISPERIQTVFNSYEPSEYAAYSHRPGPVFRITYTGGISIYRDISPFFQALFELIKEKKVDSRRIKLIFCGQYFNYDLEHLARRAGVAIELKGLVPYHEIPRILVESDLLLLIKNPVDTMHIPGKLFEYMGAGRPIFMMGARECEAADIIMKYQLGEVAPHDDSEGIKKSLLKFYRDWQDGNSGLKLSSQLAEKFSTEAMSRKIVEVFEATAATKIKKASIRKTRSGGLEKIKYLATPTPWLRLMVSATEFLKLIAGSFGYHLRFRDLLDYVAGRLELNYSVALVIHSFYTAFNRPNRLGKILFTYNPGRFEEQVIYLKNRFQVGDLDSLFNGEASNKATITFDDGYRYFYTLAWPVLKRHRAPATVFLSTRAIDSPELLWFDKALYYFESTEDRQLRIGDRNYPLRIEGEKVYARDKFLRYLKTLPHRQLEDEVDRLWKSLPEEVKSRLPRIMLNWEEICRLYEQGAKFGSHSVNHPILSRLTAEKVEQELFDSKVAIEKELKEKISYFAYPEGSPNSISPEIEDQTLDHYRAAFTSIQNIIKPQPTLSRIPRIGIRPSDRVSFLDLKINLFLLREIIAHVMA